MQRGEARSTRALRAAAGTVGPLSSAAPGHRAAEVDPLRLCSTVAMALRCAVLLLLSASAARLVRGRPAANHSHTTHTRDPQQYTQQTEGHIRSRCECEAQCGRGGRAEEQSAAAERNRAESGEQSADPHASIRDVMCPPRHCACALPHCSRLSRAVALRFAAAVAPAARHTAAAAQRAAKRSRSAWMEPRCAATATAPALELSAALASADV